MTERPFVPWIETETICNCWRWNCRHKRRDAERALAQRLQREMVEALTDGDIDWLREMGWSPPSEDLGELPYEFSIPPRRWRRA